jgi:adenosyl cobinamide kinase/adenosyl cobinamide phosphate guanylyltransferase
MTLWVSNLLFARLGEGDDMAADTAAAAADGAVTRARALADWAARFEGDVAIVSNEVGMGVVPAYPLGRAFRDALGAANSAVAARADHVYWLVARLAVELKALGARPLDAFGEGRAP